MKWMVGIIGALALSFGVAQAETYALLVRGDDTARYVNHTRNAYRTLRKGGVPQENIIVLGNGDAQPLDGASTKENLERALEMMGRKVTAEDTFILWMRDHGVMDGDDARFILDNDFAKGQKLTYENWLALRKQSSITPRELEVQMRRISPKKGYLLFDFCYGGQFADLGVDEFIAFSSSFDSSSSRRYLAWSNFLLEAIVRGKGDADHDGMVTPQEMLKYAERSGAEVQPYVSSTKPLSYFSHTKSTGSMIRSSP